MTQIANTLTSFVIMLMPVGIYALVVRLRLKLSTREIAQRLGLQGTSAPFVAVGLAGGLIAGIGSWLSLKYGMGYKGEHSPIAPYVDQPPSVTMVLLALVYSCVAVAEEVLFRGLIAGVLFRRVSRPWLANLFQAIIFIAPHLAILFLRPDMAVPLLTLVLPLSLGLGWLRHRSGSVVPSALAHQLGNFITALAVMRW